MPLCTYTRTCLPKEKMPPTDDHFPGLAVWARNRHGFGLTRMTPYQAVANFGKAATVLHRLLHQSVPLTDVQREFIKTELQTLQVALSSYNSKNPPQG